MATLRRSLAILGLVAVAVARAQEPPRPRWAFVSLCEATGTASKCTLSLPAGAPGRLRPLVAMLACAAADCTYTVSRDGSTPTATAAPVTKLRTAGGAARGRAWAASNSTGGTTVGGPIGIPAGAPISIELTDLEILPGENVSIAMASATSQKLTVYWKWEEIPQ